MGLIGCPESSAVEDGTDRLFPNVANNYHYLLRNNPVECSSYPLLGGSPISRDDLRTLYGSVQFWVLKMATECCCPLRCDALFLGRYVPAFVFTVST
jgi:hypothetical protein